MTRNTATVSTLFFALAASALSAQAPPQPRPPESYSMFLQAQYAGLKRNIIGSAEKMPAEHFSFKPSPEVRTYAQQLGHIIDTQYLLLQCRQGRSESWRREGFRKDYREDRNGPGCERCVRVL